MALTFSGATRARLSRAYLLGACLVWVACSDVSPPEAEQPSVWTIQVDGLPVRVWAQGLEAREDDQPVFVLFSGAAAPLEVWGDWSAQLSELAPVVAYDRPGVGESPFDGIEPTLDRVTEHAHRALAALQVSPPYVLVGWSWGGPLIRAFAGRFPGDVVGMVYLDPTDMDSTPMESAGASSIEELRQIYAQLDSAVATRQTSPGSAAERRVITEFNRSEPAERGLAEDLDVPAVVVLAKRAPPIPSTAPGYVTESWYQELFARRERQFGDWADRQPNRSLIVVEESGHVVHRDAPSVALEAARVVLDAARARAR